MATKVKEIMNVSNVLVPIVIAQENVTVFLPPGEKMENVVVENYHTISKYCKSILDLTEVAPKGKKKLND